MFADMVMLLLPHDEISRQAFGKIADVKIVLIHKVVYAVVGFFRLVEVDGFAVVQNFFKKALDKLLIILP